MEEEASLRGRWDSASLLLVQESTKPCPQCSVPVERNGESDQPGADQNPRDERMNLMDRVAVSPCRRLHAHAVSSVRRGVVLDLWRQLEQRLYGEPLVWLTGISGRRGLWEMWFQTPEPEYDDYSFHVVSIYSLSAGAGVCERIDPSAANIHGLKLLSCSGSLCFCCLWREQPENQNLRSTQRF